MKFYKLCCLLAFLFMLLSSAPSAIGPFEHATAAQLENAYPVLTLGSVSPERGRAGASFTFRVTYFHPENVPPIYVYLKLDNFLFPENFLWENYVTFSMCFVEGSPIVGSVYAFTWKSSDEDVGIHVYYFEARVGDLILRFPENYALHGPEVIGPENNTPPILMDGAVSPQEGDGGTTFEYSVKYWDNEWDAPSHIDVYIDGNRHPMTFRGEVDNALVYGYSWHTTAGEVGDHVYWFEAGDGIDNCRLPETGFFEGPRVREPPPPGQNRPPSLSGGAVNPATGTPGQTFTFEVTYFDADGDSPSTVVVIIDNTELEMERVSGDPVTGILYRYLLSGLGRGTHFYHFEASDGKTDVRFPVSGLLIGPTVVESAQTSEHILAVAILAGIVFLISLLIVFYFLRRRYRSED